MKKIEKPIEKTYGCINSGYAAFGFSERISQKSEIFHSYFIAK